MPFYCTICEQESTLICAVCTKDTCANHLCGKCASCSDCCTCELALEEPEIHVKTRYTPLRTDPDVQEEPAPEEQI